jgi:hypothetical protein
MHKGTSLEDMKWRVETNKHLLEDKQHAELT